ncbi:MAG: cation diffusion facilitator family transporter [Lachnospiraceae bacterium]|nr:cation diffusion facilitator family transporter [Lachnospiraceae bacterium]
MANENSKNNKKNSRELTIVRVSMVGIIANIFLAGFKAFIGLLSNSIAIVLDSVNNLSDALSSVITIVGMKLAGKPADKNHPFGHGRIEYITTLIIAGIVIAAGVASLIESVKKIIHPQKPTYDVITFIIIGVAVIVKIILGIYFKKKGKEVNSDTLKALGSDASFDAVISIGTLISAAIMLIFKISIDGILGVFIACVIIKAGSEMIGEALDLILGSRIDIKFSRDIKMRIREFDEVHGVYDLIINNYGPEIMVGSAHIEVNDDLTAKQINTLTRKIEKVIRREYGIILTIGIYAVNEKDDNYIKIRRIISEQIAKEALILQIHGLYIDEDEKNISFDIIIDFEADDPIVIMKNVEEAIKKELPGYTFDIVIDRDYSD